MTHELAQLRARTDDAIHDLVDLRNSDPAADDAIHAVRLTMCTLQSFWAPALDRATARPAALRR